MKVYRELADAQIEEIMRTMLSCTGVPAECDEVKHSIAQQSSSSSLLR